MKTCPTGAIHFGTKKEMLEVAEERVAKLKKRGYANAGIYNPPGVGGTPRDVRPASCRPAGAVSQAAKEPQIDTSISLWKGALKPLAAAGFIAHLRRADLPLHRYRPNKEVDDDEEKHDE
ncbi:formate dehydrogenase N subunit beta [Klebsiella pneumoniae]|uniref:Formate dehydrogenase N subunit beta n=1 Tax=Klebsiella pneumoniae TaxID=573 RepID=A0A3S4IIA6_KLEPN|nr:formate dehydrogenase N subunit beta [Klebsiella pneumoniae]